MERDKLICPYCGKEQYMHELDEISSNMNYTECEHCGNTFFYSVEVIRYYSAYTDYVEE